MRTPESGPRPAPLDAPELLDLLPVGVAQLAADGTVVRVNATLRRMFDLPDDAEPGRGIAVHGWSMSLAEEAELLAELVAEAEARDGDDDTSPGRLTRVDHARCGEKWVRIRVRRLHPVGSGDPVGRSDPVAYVAVVVDVSEEHRLAEELRTERERYRLVADHAGDVVLVHRDHEIVWASPSVAHVLGRDPASLLGLTLADIGGPGAMDDLPPLPPEGASVGHRVQLWHADGTLHWFQAKLTAQDAPDGVPIVYAWLRDVEETVRAERALADSERRLRRAFEVSPDGWIILAVEPDPGAGRPILRYALANARTRELSGRPQEEILGRTLEEVVPSDALPWMYAQVDRATATGQVVTGRAPLPVGDETHLFDTFVALLDDRTVLCSWRDVTDVVKAQELLHRAYEETAEMRATLQTALDATSDGFAVYRIERDESGDMRGLRVVHANAAGAESLSLESDAMVDMEIHDYFPEVEASGLWERILEAVATKSPQYHRVHVFDDDGSWVSAWDNTVAPVGEERMAITWRDVSAEEAAIRQLARTRDEAMYSATHDALTDLPNRVLLRQHLHEALRSCRPDERVGLVFVDLDKFKAINDTHGHAAGDAVLRATAKRLGRMVRHGDLAARLAGDEFVLVLTALAPDWSPEQFFARASGQLSEPVTFDTVELRPSASLGAVLADPCRESVDVDGLIELADAAMYKAKAASRDR